MQDHQRRRSHHEHDHQPREEPREQAARRKTVAARGATRDALAGRGWQVCRHGLPISAERHAARGLEMIGHKIARVLAGDCNHKDHWMDIGGYAQLVVRELENGDDDPE